MSDYLSDSDLTAFEMYLDAQLRAIGRGYGRAPASAGIFIDVKPSDDCFDSVNVMFHAGLTVGHTARPPQFCPNDTITREEMAVFVATAVEGGRNFAYTTTPYFTDVLPTEYSFKFIQKLEDIGIANRCTLTQFCPEDPVTRGEMAAFIIAARYESTPYIYPETPYFTDVPASHRYFPFIQKMAHAGIAEGCAPGQYGPDQTLTRGQTAIFIVKGLLNQLVAGAPIIATAVPNRAAPGQTLTVTLTGANTHFAQGATQVATAPGITASDIVIASETSLRMQLAVAAMCVPNPTSIIVTTDTEEAVLPNGFVVR